MKLLAQGGSSVGKLLREKGIAGYYDSGSDVGDGWGSMPMRIADWACW